MKQPNSTYFTSTSLPDLARQLNDSVRRSNEQLNSLSEGRLASLYTAQDAPPTIGPYAVGDFVPNRARGVVLGTVGAQYLLWGWTCIADAEPPQWVETRFMTGT